MRNELLTVMLFAALSASPSAHSDACDSLGSLHWLLGDWIAERGATTFHESWVEIGSGTYEGTAVERANADGAVQSAEALRLVEMAGGVFYVSKVSRNELPVAFRLSECAGNRLVFVNPRHDFPRRIEYVRGRDGRVDVRVSDGADKGFTLNFVRVPAPIAPSAPVLAAEDARFAAMVAADTKEMRRWFAADLEYVHSSGAVENREQLVDSIASGRMRYIAIVPVERRVSFLSDTAATVHGLSRMEVAAGTTPLEFRIRYLAVYKLIDGAWQLRAWQSVRLP